MTDARESVWIIEKREAAADHGMVTAMSPLAARAGLDMLKAGGNAVDAAVATAFAIGVVEPFMSGLGGVAVMVHYRAENGQTVVVDGSSTAPSAAQDDMFELAADTEQGGMYGWRATKDDQQNTGYRSPIVPATPACLLHSLARYGSGRLSRQQVMAPAIRLAEEGFPIDPYVAQTIAFAMRRLRQFPETMRTLFHEDGTPLVPATLSKAADRLVQPNLARSLQMLADHGAEVFYQGEIGKRIVADLQANGGVISDKDFAGYQVREFSPGLVQTYRGHTLVGVPETSGCVTTYQMLNVLENFNVAELEYGAPEVAHLVAEASRRAFLDRFAHLADPARCQAPFEGVLSKAYAAELAAGISLERADPEAAAGDPWRFQPRSAYSGGEPARAAISGRGGCTTHMTAVDSNRNVVSLTSTLGELFGCGVMAGGTGILLNNGLTWFDPEPGRINSIEPGKRIFWAPSPTIVLKDGRPLLAVGAPGARRIISAIAQSLINLVDFGMGIQAAVSAPRVHCEGPITQAEARLEPAVLDGLAARGHRLEVVQETSTSLSFARPNGIRIDPATNRLTAGVNQFVPAWAMGY